MPFTSAIPVSFGPDIASQRARAISAFLDTVRRLLPDPQQAQPAQLQAVAQALEQLGLRKDLFVPAHFPVSAADPAHIYRLAEDADGRYALYISAALPGKGQPPHDHTTWAIIAGVQGNERNVVYGRQPTDDPARDRLEPLRSIDVVPGTSVTLTPDEVHTIVLLDGAPGLHLHLYGLALDRLVDRVVFEGLEGGSYRTFAPPALIRHARIAPQTLQAALEDGEDIAVLDVRDKAERAVAHIPYTVSAPLERLEPLVEHLVPNRGTRTVLVDADETRAHLAAATLVRQGWLNVSVLTGGTNAWFAAGYALVGGSQQVEAVAP